MAVEAKLQKKIVEYFTELGCIVLKQNAGAYSKKGVPDLIILGSPKWVALEVKASEDASFQPLQEYNQEKYNKQGFARVVYPKNWPSVRDEATKYLGV